MPNPKLIQDIKKQFNNIILKNQRLGDFIIPPGLFFIINYFTDISIAIVTAVLIGFILVITRIIKKQNWKYSLIGLIILLVTAGVSFTQNKPELFFIPGIIQNIAIIITIIISLILKKPLLAYTSHLTRHWPIKWYWHPQIKPAYTETTIFWLIFFIFKFSVELLILLSNNIDLLINIRFITGWPSILLILIITYIYGTNRLKKLKGPSVKEFLTQIPSPWKSQRSGF